MYIIVLLQIVAVTAFATDVPSLDAFEDGIVQHLRSYDGLEFSITSSFTQEDGEGHKMEQIDTARETIRFHFPAKGPAWKYWVQEIQDSFDKKWIHNRFKVTDVVSTHNFLYAEEQAGKWSAGDITPWHEWDEANGRVFFTIISLDTVGMSLLETNVTAEFRHSVISGGNIQFVKKYVFDGYDAFVFTGKGKNGKTAFEIHITQPGCVVVHLEYRNSEGRGRIFHVDKLGSFEGICYPQKGFFYQDANIFREYKYDYKFEVTKVQRFDPDFLKNWFPEWPPLTSVHDIAYDKTTRIPPNERQLKKVAEQWHSSYKIEPRPMTWTVFRIIIAVIGTVMILTALYMLWKRKK
jgi:hypothetical protein